MRYYIIEHPRRGLFIDIDYGLGGGAPRPHFSVFGCRTDDNVSRFLELDGVRRVLHRFPHHLRTECVVMQSPNGDGDWEKVEVDI